MYPSDLSKVTILLKTMMRDAHLYDAVAGIRETMPEAKILVVDDGDSIYKDPRKREWKESFVVAGGKYVLCPFDSGFGFKSNAAIRALDTSYLLISSDDFDHRPAFVRQGVEKMVAVLDAGIADVASGRVNNAPYEGWLTDEVTRVTEYRLKTDKPKHANGVTYHPCHLTVNYSLIRAEILGFEPGQVSWDDDIKIGGGEHGAQFVKLKRACRRIVYVEGANICEQSSKPVDPRYPAMRGRARQPGRLALSRLGIREYVLFDGAVERT